MTKTEFIKEAKEFGYSDIEIQDLLDLQEETKLPFDKFILIEQIVN